MRPSGMCRRNKVVIQRVRFTVGNAGGPTALGDPSQSPIRCSVQPKGVELLDVNGRMTRMTSFEVHFSDDPGVEARDFLIWLDASPVQTLTVLGSRRASGLTTTWLVDCESIQ